MMMETLLGLYLPESLIKLKKILNFGLPEHDPDELAAFERYRNNHA
jgi:hypothetical protein